MACGYGFPAKNSEGRRGYQTAGSSLYRLWAERPDDNRRHSVDRYRVEYNYLTK
jgi:hypothetical protein